MTKDDLYSRLTNIARGSFEYLHGVSYGAKLMSHLSPKELRYALKYAIFFDEDWVGEAKKQICERGTPLERLLLERLLYEKNRA